MKDTIKIALNHNNTLTLTKTSIGCGNVSFNLRESNEFPYTHIPPNVWDDMGEDEYDYDISIGIKMTYSYIHPDLSTESGDDHDTGYVLRDLPENTRIMTAEAVGDLDIVLPGNRGAYSSRVNDLKNLTDEQTIERFDHDDLCNLFSSMYIYDEAGRFSDMNTFIVHILSNDHGYYTGEYTDGVTIEFHRPN